MERIILKRWFQLTVGAIVLFVVGFLIPSIFLKTEIPAERPDRLVLQTEDPTLSRDLPLTAAEAVDEGWRDPGKCLSQNNLLGRYFGWTVAAEPERPPYLPIYDADDALLGVYMFGETELAPPWQHQENGLADVENMDFEHWGVHVYVRDTATACQVTAPS